MLQLARFRGLIDWSSIAPDDLVCLAAIYQQNDLYVEAEEMYMRALRGREKAWGPEHTSTLRTVNNLGNLYADQGKMAEAEEMYARALRGYEKAVGTDHWRTRTIARNLHNLHNLYK
jgi:tetratricopeptide (TPR) repeat protein